MRVPRLSPLAAGVAVSFLLAAPALAQSLRTTRVASGLNYPVFVTHAPGDDERIFIVEKPGEILVMDIDTGTITSFLNIAGIVGGGNSTNDERGLLGLAFHPAYQSNGFFYVYYTDNSNDAQISRFSVLGDPATSNSADSTSEVSILNVNQPQTNHNGGWIGFGPNDGYLYVATGDGGFFCDTGGGHTAGTGNAQDITNNLLGKILRLDVDGGSPYAIPGSNPFVGVTGDDEIWCYGLRNPYRCAFDSATGDLYIGDVGQDNREELDYQPAASLGGENYGWRCREGFSCSSFNPSGCGSTTGCNCPSADPGLTDPIIDFTHVGGFGVCSIIGGYVYRGSCIPDLVGTYFLSDFCAGDIWTLDVVGGVAMNFQTVTGLSPSIEGVTVNQVTSFGEDNSGELYIVDQGTGSSGQVFKIVPAALSVLRTGGTNPSSYASNAPELGGTFTATVDNGSVGQTTSVLFAFDTPASFTLGGGQVLLAADGGQGEMFTGVGLPPSSSGGGFDNFSLPVPNSVDLLCLPLYSQAIQFGSPPYVLTNARDLLIGY